MALFMINLKWQNVAKFFGHCYVTDGMLKDKADRMSF